MSPITKLKVPNSTVTHRNAGDPHVLPPNTTSAQFAQFIERVTSIVGSENILIVETKEQLNDGTYKEPNKTHDMHAVLDRDYFVCSASVAPRNVPDVQDLMRLANEFDIPVWPFSIGRNTGYGGAAPRVPGSVSLDLGKHMNRVLEVNTDDAYAVVEPGVTYFGLHEYMEKRGLREKVWMDVSNGALLTGVFLLINTFRSLIWVVVRLLEIQLSVVLGTVHMEVRCSRLSEPLGLCSMLTA
jgi:hypothetical protein